MNEIKQTLQQDADALLKRLQQSRKNGTGVTLSVSDVGVLCEAFKQLNDGFLNLKANSAVEMRRSVFVKSIAMPIINPLKIPARQVLF